MKKDKRERRKSIVPNLVLFVFAFTDGRFPSVAISFPFFFALDLHLFDRLFEPKGFLKEERENKSRIKRAL